jgi:hypothetical protein
MAGWSDIALVLAGSAGPLVVTLATQRGVRRDRAEDRRREDLRARQSLYAEFVAACTQVDADWCDYALFPPRSFEEERELDAVRDGHYASLNLLAAQVRLTAPPAVVAAGEGMLAELREVQVLARASQRGAPDDHVWAEHRRSFTASRDGFLVAAKGAFGAEVPEGAGT